MDHLKFLISRYGWKVTKLYSHFTFQQSKFKKDFISMNQKSWQTAKNAIEKDFYKLLNNAIYDEIGEFTYIRKYHNLFDNEVSKFVNSSLIEKEIEKTYNEKLLQTNDDNFLKISKIEYLKTEKKKKLKKKNEEALRQLQQKEKKNTHTKKIIKILEKRLDEANKNPKVKGITDSDEASSNSVKSIAVKKTLLLKQKPDL